MNLNWLTALEIGLVIVVGLALYALARRGIRTLTNRSLLSEQAAMVMGSVVKWLFIIAVTLTSLNILNISATTLWASLSAVLMLVALGFVAVWSILSNASCALFLVIFSPFRIGDEIELMDPAVLDPAKPGLRGKVITITFLYTVLSETDCEGNENLVHVPNNLFFQRAIRCRKGSNTTPLRSALFESVQKKQEEKEEAL